MALYDPIPVTDLLLRYGRAHVPQCEHVDDQLEHLDTIVKDTALEIFDASISFPGNLGSQ